LKLWAPKDNTRARKALIVAKYVGVELEIPVVEMGKTNKTAEFLRMNPRGKVPVLETIEGGAIAESNAIARYIASLKPELGLLGRNGVERAQVDQWCDFVSGEIDPAAFAWLGPILGYCSYTHEAYEFAQTQLKEVFTALNRHLETRTYLVGERLTVADIVVTCSLVTLYQRVLDPKWRNPYLNVNRWFETITQKALFSSVWHVDIAAWCVVAQKAAAPKKEAKKDHKEEHHEEKGKGKKEEKAEEKKEEKKDDKKKKKKGSDDEEEEDEHKEEKKKNPLDDLPKSTFIIDDYKREFSNKPLDESMEYLKKNFDSAGWTMWIANYKYNAENSKIFMSTNLIAGFFNRMDRFRKYAFGIMAVHGEDGKNDIAGFWIIRSHEVPQIMRDECDDLDLYEWTKLDFPLSAENEKIARVYLGKQDLNGKPYADGRAYK